MNVPFLDLKTQYRALALEMDEALHGVMANADFILGKDVELFEQEFAAYCGVPYAVGLDSGISALELALRALGVGPGDEVMTVSHTFIATVSAISFTGAKPVFVDVRPDTFNLDTRQLEAAITPRTKAILPVHLYGQPADLDPILDAARKHHLAVIEDACQAHGARYRGQRVGSFGEAGCFSFYPGKNLGAYGDGGLLVTHNRELAEKVRMLRNYGQREKYHHLFLAYNHRLDSMQAAVLRVKLKRLDDWNAARQKLAQRYRLGLEGLSGVVVPAEAPDRTHVYHLYVIQHPDRDGLAAFLRQRGVATGLHYPIPVHRQPCYESLGVAPGSLPVTESLAPRILTLPMFPEMTTEQVDYVCEQIRGFS
jgi:dTDP-4-amino-4,6-dideoxygalactose transaminase